MKRLAFSGKARGIVCSLVVLAMLAACQPNAENGEMKALTDFATRYAAAWSSQDPELFASFYADNGVLQVNDSEPSVGRAAITETARSFMSAFPDMLVELTELRQVGDQLQFHWRWTGTNTGPEGTGAAVDMRGYEQWTLDADSLIAKSLGHYDEAEYERQLNAGRQDNESLFGGEKTMNDEQQIKEVIQTYFDCMYESSAEKARVAFHPNAKITGYLEDGLHQMSVDDFAGFVASQQPSPKDQGAPARLEILSIEIAGNTASARVRDDYLGMTFLDSLSLLKVDGRWSIYNKLFHVEGPAG